MLDEFMCSELPATDAIIPTDHSVTALSDVRKQNQ